MNGNSVAFLRKLILSMETENREGWPLSVSTCLRNPSIKTKVLLLGMGFLLLYLLKLKHTMTGRTERGQLYLKKDVYCVALMWKKPSVLLELIAGPEMFKYARCFRSSTLAGMSYKKVNRVRVFACK